jgi:hypothetical protein
MLDGGLNLEEHRQQAAEYPRIVALPITVGSCAEVLDFFGREELRKILAVVLPTEHHGGYFAALLRDDERRLTIRGCGPVADAEAEIDANLGKMFLMELAGPLCKVASTSAAQRQTAARRGPDSVQAREAQAHGEAVATAPSTALAKWVLGSAALVILSVALVALAGASWMTTLVVGVVLLMVLLIIGPFALRTMGLLSEPSFVSLTTEVIKQVPAIVGRLRGGTDPDAAELPSEDNERSSGERRHLPPGAED